jgi:hypothetical protein
MIKDIVDLLNTADYYGQSEHIDIAKGKYALPHSWKDAWGKIKRHAKSDKKPFGWADIWYKIKTYKWQTKK